MPYSFIHLSDIHFGQERGAEIVVHNDVKDRLIDDAAEVVKKHGGGKATGVLVTGDIAYAGKRTQYEQAGDWLDRLATAIGCKTTAVQIVPGNHDIDRDAISAGCEIMLEQITAAGQPKLDAFLANELDREVLYGRFAEYRRFAEGYNCPLDKCGGYASDRKLLIAPGRTLRFIGLNSALACGKNDKEGALLLGAVQHVLPRNPGEELVVLGHHPLHWLRDSDDARRYVRRRARVFVSGHEHNPALEIQTIKDGEDLMMLAAGATVPPKRDADAGFAYTYNLLVFDWDKDIDGLRVTIFPRTWLPDETAFGPDDDRLGGRERTVTLGCPNFRAGPPPAVDPAAEIAEGVLVEQTPIEPEKGEAVSGEYPLLLLRFFRDLTAAQRLAVLAETDSVFASLRGPLPQTVERQIVDNLVLAGKQKALEAAIAKVESGTGGGEGKSNG